MQLRFEYGSQRSLLVLGGFVGFMIDMDRAEFEKSVADEIHIAAAFRPAEFLRLVGKIRSDDNWQHLKLILAGGMFELEDRVSDMAWLAI